MGRVSITTDCWTSINNTNFLVVTAHFIGKNWELHKKIISFQKIVSHKGADIGEAIMATLKDWDIKKIVCCTVANASANDEAVRYVKNELEVEGTNILGGKYLYMRCVAHVINLIASDGLDEIGLSVRRVRESVKWIKASPARCSLFDRAKQLLENKSTKSLCMDVPTRWNSTYLMLESTEPYEAVLKLYEGMNSGYVSELQEKIYKDRHVGPPEKDDWINVMKMIEYLKKFYDLTCLVSGTSYVTIHLFFKEMCDVFELVKELQKHPDVEVTLMADKMRKKIEKYWLEADELNPKLNKLLYVAAILDPRQKLKHVEKCLKKVYGVVRASELVKDIKESITEVFEFYKKSLTPPPRQSASHSSSRQQLDLQRKSVRRGTCSTMHDSSDEDDDSDTSELSLYLAEKKERSTLSEVESVVDNFNVLKWWSMHGVRFPILSAMANDILAIPVSTVASESAFSTGGRVLDDFRSLLNPKIVEVLICTEDWLRTTFKKDEEDTTEEEQEKEYEKVLSSFASTALGVGASSIDINLETSQATPVLPLQCLAQSQVKCRSLEIEELKIDVKL